MRNHLLSMELVWQRRCDRSWSRAAFSLCFVLIIQQSVTLTLPQSTPAVAMDQVQEAKASSFALISPLPLNDVSVLASSSHGNGRRMNVLTPGQMVINAVPKQDRPSFFMYQLAMGLRANRTMQNEAHWTRNLEDFIENTEEQLSNLKDVPIYENFPSDLLSWLMKEFNLLPVDVFNQLRSRSNLWCTSSGVCYHSDDVVCYCCPF